MAHAWRFVQLHNFCDMRAIQYTGSVGSVAVYVVNEHHLTTVTAEQSHVDDLPR